MSTPQQPQQTQSQGQQAQEAAFIDTFKKLATEMSSVTNVLAAQGISQMCDRFDGNPKHFRDWARNIEKFAKLSNSSDQKTILLAFQMSSGAVSGYIQRYTEANPTHTWAQLKRELAIRFSDVTDPYIAMTMLRKIKQNTGENIQQFNERLMTLAEEAFAGQAGDFIERQLIEIFVDGLLSEQLKLTILRKSPGTLQEAMNIAVTENNLRQRIGTSRGPVVPKARIEDKYEPMEIDHFRGMRCFKCKKVGHRSKDCKSVQVVSQSQNRKIKCWGCGIEGHILNNCPQGQQKHSNVTRRTYNPSSQGQSRRHGRSNQEN